MTEPMKNSYHSSHLLEAVEHRIPIDKVLVQKSDLNFRDHEGKNALYWAITNKSIRNVSILLEHNISLMVEKNLHALFHAIASNNLEALVYLLKQGVDVNTPNSIGQTGVMKALEMESIMMVRNLVNHGADLSIMDDNYDMAIDYATRCKNADIYNLIHYKLLYEELKTEQKDCIGCAFAQSSCNDTKEF